MWKTIFKFLKGFADDSGLTKAFVWLLASADTHSQGMSGRKATSLAIVVMVWYCHLKYVDVTVVKEVIMYDELFILLLLGIITLEQVSKLKNDKPQQATTNEEPINQ